MKKLTYLFIIMTLLLVIKVNAQTPDTSTTKKLLQYIFQNIDKSQIPTNFLEQYGCPMLPMATFNGTLTDSNRIDMNLWRTLYLQLQTGWARATAMCYYQQWFGLDVQCSAFVFNFNQIFPIGHLYRAGRYKIPHLQQYSIVMRHPNRPTVQTSTFKTDDISQTKF